ncbi:MAG: histidine phosphatase family protein [Deltaproteobacteria bacterium]|nr:histidine phosphatase family protein [Deltaproteobacteria bacterium]
MIYMIRHGQASFGHDDYDRLSPLGRRQSRVLAEHLLRTGFSPDAVYTGTMMRQKATAEEVLAVYQAGKKPLPAFDSLSGFDEYDTDSVVAALFPAMAAQDSSLNEDLSRMYSSKASFKRVFEGAMLRWVTGRFDSPGVESWEGMKARVSAALDLITERHGRGKSIAVFTSGGAIAASLADVLGICGEYAMRLNWQIFNTSITRYMYNEERITLAGFNAIAHLELQGDQTLITYR